MTTVALTAAVTLALAVALAVVLRRDLKRAQARTEVARLMAKMRGDTQRMAEQLGMALLPAMRHLITVTNDLARQLRKAQR